MTHRQIIRVALVLAAAHLAVTSAIGYYAAYQVGGSAGQSVANLLIDAYESSGTMSQPALEERYREISKTVAANAERWKPAFLFASLPAQFAIEPMFKPLSHHWLEQGIAGRLSAQQWRVRMYSLLAIENLLNSACFGLLVYLVLRVVGRRHAP